VSLVLLLLPPRLPLVLLVLLVLLMTLLVVAELVVISAHVALHLLR